MGLIWPNMGLKMSFHGPYMGLLKAFWQGATVNNKVKLSRVTTELFVFLCWETLHRVAGRPDTFVEKFVLSM